MVELKITGIRSLARQTGPQEVEDADADKQYLAELKMAKLTVTKTKKVMAEEVKMEQGQENAARDNPKQAKLVKEQNKIQ